MDLPLSLLRAFEAAAQDSSFKEASVRLGRTPSAVSHAIRKLEELLGTSLFERTGRNLRLTVDGMALMRQIGPAFQDLRRGMELVSARGANTLRVHAAPSFAAQWLTPRLASFFAINPETEIRLAASNDYTNFTTDEFDLDIVYRRPDLQGVNILPLGEETVTPMCSPALAGGVRAPQDLLKCPLIDSDYKQVRWNDWFTANGLQSPPPRAMRFDRSFLSIKAAVDGLGVTLESTRLAERELSTGQLVRPLAASSTDIRYTGHYLVFPDHALRRKPLRTFIDWLVGELGIVLDLPNNL